MPGETWRENELLFVQALRETGKHTWDQIAEHVEKKFKFKCTGDQVRLAWTRNKQYFDLGADEAGLRLARSTRLARRTSSLNARTTRLALDALEKRDAVSEAIESAAGKIKGLRLRPPRQPIDKRRHGMTLELMISDVHVGKLVRKGSRTIYDIATVRRRVREIARVVRDQVLKAQAHDNVERIVVGLLGDIIESFEMHDLESARNCEFGSPRQVEEAIVTLADDLLIPLADLGIPMDVVGVTGNHDRTERKKTYVDPGANNWTWVIYRMLERAITTRYPHTKFHIPEDPFVVLEIYGMNVLYEHLDNMDGKPDQRAFERLMADRGRQLDIHIDAVRGGHWHEKIEFGVGRVIVNPSMVGDESYGRVRGWRSVPAQLLNFYLDYPIKPPPGARPNNFHKTFPIKLE